MGDSWFEKAFGAHYPLLYRHRDEAEARTCLELLPRLAPLVGDHGRLTLDLGCGDGRHLELLGQAGIPAAGLDLSADLLRRATDRSWPDDGPLLVRGDMRSLPFGPGSFASVLSLFTAFGYFGPPAANQAPVGEIARVLAPGGHWFLDYFDGDRVRDELGSGDPLVRERELGPLLVREERSFLAGESLVSKRVRLKPIPDRDQEAAGMGIPAEGLEYTERVAVFTLEDLDGMTEREGLSRVAAAGGYEGQALGEGSRWILVYRKSTKDVRI